MEPHDVLLIVTPAGLVAATSAFASVIVSKRRPASETPHTLFSIAIAFAIFLLFFCGIRVHFGFGEALEGASDPQRAHIALASGLAEVLWAAAGASGILTLLVPMLAICGVWLVRVRARVATSNAVIGALGIGGASVTSGVLLYRQVSSLRLALLNVSPTPPAERATRFAELARPLVPLAFGLAWALAFCAVLVATVSLSRDDVLRRRFVGLAALFAIKGHFTTSVE